MTTSVLYDVAVERGSPADEWDQFLSHAPGGHHVQTSLWAEVKAVLGWRATRIVVRREGEITGGCQVLLRDVGPLGVIGYAPRSPVVHEDDMRTLDLVLGALDDLATQERVLYLKVQPPANRSNVEGVLLSRGFVASSLETAPSATVRIELGRSPEELLTAMRSGARSNIRKAERKGVTVRCGGEEDLKTFCQIVASTARRQGFSPYPDAYYGRMWRAFAERGQATLMIAEREGRALSAALLIGWGDTVIYKMGGWSGERSDIHPNELLHWSGILWSKEGGYRWYDLEGIDREVASAVVTNQAIPPSGRTGPDRFKLGLGGQVTLFPVAYDRAYRPPLGPVVSRLATLVGRSQPLVHRIVRRGK